jgi:putative membrane protein
MARDNRVAGVVAGIVGGLAGTWAMSEFQGWWSRKTDGFESPSAGGRHDARDWQERREGTNANEIAAQQIAAHTIDRPLTREELEAAAPALHYAFGATLGGMYGAFAETSPSVRAGGGAAYGSAVWIGADGIAMPLLGLSESTGDRPFELHAQSFAAHIVFGVTTELVRRTVRGLLP